MFFATAGGGTEPFLASEIKEKLDAKVSFRNGKVFFSKKDITSSDLQIIISLKAAERVFVMIAEYDNSNFISDKRVFLDKIMAWLSQKNIYAEADIILKQTKDILTSQQGCVNKVSKRSQEMSKDSQTLKRNISNLAEDEIGLSDSKKKYLRTEDFDCRQLPAKELFEAPVKSCKGRSEEPFNDPFTFRVSVKCSGKMKKRLDTKRLSRDIGWRVERASGWKIQLRQPDLEVCVHISDEHVTVGVPLTRLPLSKRYYLQDPGLRTPVAWIMCTLAEIKPGDIILDPMCGKATILLEGTSNWKDAFCIGSDNSIEQINIAAQNVLQSNLGAKVDICTSDGLHMPYRDCCADVILCDPPFNQNHSTSSNPDHFYQHFLREIYRVLRPGGKCVMLLSEELASVVLSHVQNSTVSDTTDTNSEDAYQQGLTLKASFQQIPVDSFENHVNDSNATLIKTLINSGDEPLPNLQLKRLSSGEKSDKLKDTHLTLTRQTPVSPVACGEKINNALKTCFMLASQHPVKLGETLACILKLVKR